MMGEENEDWGTHELEQLYFHKSVGALCQVQAKHSDAQHIAAHLLLSQLLTRGSINAVVITIAA